MIDKSLEEISRDDVERKEFLADVSSFANAAGGDLVYGVVEAKDAEGRNTGVPAAINGIAGAREDADLQRLENMLRDGIHPRLPGVHLRWILGFPDGPALIIRVPRSWAGPHMVTYQQHSRFYARAANTKYALDVFQLREAFLSSGSVAERAREFRTARLGQLMAGELPTPLTRTSLVCLHFIPHVSLTGAFEIDLHAAANKSDSLTPIGARGMSWTFNLDGFLTYSPSHTASSIAYLQLYRNGTIESVSSEILGVRRDEDGQLLLPSLGFADQVAEALGRLKALMRKLGVEPPASFFVSLIGARGARLGIHPKLSFHNDMHARPLDRDVVLFRDVLIRDWEGSANALLKPLLDELWQAAGFPRCFDYDESGNWKPMRVF